jgi:hypothetical protein
MKFKFDKKLATKLQLNENYNYITVDREDGELWAGFHKSDGRVTEVMINEEQLKELKSKEEK